MVGELEDGRVTAGDGWSAGGALSPPQLISSVENTIAAPGMRRD